eukprot:TRINITY_DN27559_c0_g1_i1.p1 TRINITY_DN27559_c0_g1~~TRINITY_DN27559_c0_g1_i1.p1  ORF type:complete len:922 (+),score=147.50 TRINITY_DN27559_c0_g1_i1:169-2934(+)
MLPGRSSANSALLPAPNHTKIGEAHDSVSTDRTKLPRFGVTFDATNFAPHLLWRHEGRPDITPALPELAAQIEHVASVVGTAASAKDVCDASELSNIAVRSILILTNLAYSERLRDRIVALPGFLKLILLRVLQMDDEPSIANVYLGLLYRLTFRLDGSIVLSALSVVDAERFLSWLANAIISSDRSYCEPAPLLGVLANLSKASLATRAYVKGLPVAPQLYKTLARLLAGPEVLCIVYAMQVLAALVLDDDIGASLFGEDNMRRIFDLIFSLVREADHNDHARNALRPAADLLEGLFQSVRVLEIVESIGGVQAADVEALLAALTGLVGRSWDSSCDTALPLLELANALLRPPAVRIQLQGVVHESQHQGGFRSPVGALLAFAACPHADVARVSSGVAGALCRNNEMFGYTLAPADRGHAVESLVQAAGLWRGDGSSASSSSWSLAGSDAWPWAKKTNGSESPVGSCGTEAGAVEDRRAQGQRVSSIVSLLRELARTKTFGDVAKELLREAPLARAAKVALHDGDGALFLAILLLVFQMGSDLSISVRRDVLLFARSPAAATSWARTLLGSTDMQALHDCLVLACRLMEDASTISTTVCLEPSAFLQTLATINGARANEMESARAEVTRVRSMRSQDLTKAEGRLLEQSREEEARCQEAEAERNSTMLELREASSELVDAQRRLGVFEVASAEHASALEDVRGLLRASDMSCQDAELRLADLVQRAQKAEALCRQLSGRVEDQGEQIERLIVERDGFFAAAEGRKRAELLLSDARVLAQRLAENCDRVRLELHSECATLTETTKELAEEYRQARAHTHDIEATEERQAALFVGRASDFARRLEDAEADLRAVRSERDEALREASLLRCDLSVEQQLRIEQEYRLNSRHTRSNDCDSHSVQHESRTSPRSYLGCRFDPSTH